MQKHFFPGRFIVFEGLDGSGQSTQAKKLRDYLKRGGFNVIVTKEPTSGIIGRLIKRRLQDKWNCSMETLQLLFCADRADHLNKEIVPYLKRGYFVICDRYAFSTIAYGALEIKDWKWLKSLNKNFILPDIVFLLKVSPSTCIKRIMKRKKSKTIFEKEILLKRVWRNYEKLSKEFPNVCVINGEKGIPQVFEDIKNIITTKFC